MKHPEDSEEQKEFIRELAEARIESSYEEKNLKKLRPQVYFYIAATVIACVMVVWRTIVTAMSGDYTLMFIFIGALGFIGLLLMVYLFAYISYRRLHRRNNLSASDEGCPERISDEE